MLRLLPGGSATGPGPLPGPLLATGLPTAVDDLAVDDAAGPGPDERIGYADTGCLARLPDPRPLAGQLAQAVVEVLAGDRPLPQLLTWLTEDLYQELSVLAPDPVTTPTLRGARVVTIHPQDRPKVRSVHVCRPTDGVAEVAARVQTNGRSRAVALRLEEWRGRWRCCALTVG